MTKSTQRARHASESKSAIRQRTKNPRTSESAKAKDGLFVKTDVTPEEFFQAWSRKKREALIELLIDTLDAEASDPDLEDGGDTEPNLAGYELSSSLQDDAEGDELEHGGEAEQEDDESSHGFLECFTEVRI
ncbi:hypothetical protein GGQ85_001661 [Nitrobacter vulgaris]|uniref:hypothetical protein n=1 Tax=Nitrobacter vulgaris TaxID=29421 RepID=UPI002859BB6F|nr:hypothetical protein [Nitrobacter vulgaris]MDR6303962.1 hypothetical protein [Nitrobacter vulgaris]